MAFYRYPAPIPRVSRRTGGAASRDGAGGRHGLPAPRLRGARARIPDTPDHDDAIRSQVLADLRRCVDAAPTPEDNGPGRVTVTYRVEAGPVRGALQKAAGTAGLLVLGTRHRSTRASQAEAITVTMDSLRHARCSGRAVPLEGAGSGAHEAPDQP